MATNCKSGLKKEKNQPIKRTLAPSSAEYDQKRKGSLATNKRYFPFHRKKSLGNIFCTGLFSDLAHTVAKMT